MHKLLEGVTTLSEINIDVHSKELLVFHDDQAIQVAQGRREKQIAALKGLARFHLNKVHDDLQDHRLLLLVHKV